MDDPEKNDPNGPLMIEISGLRERVARLEERTESLEDIVNYLKQRIEKLDSKIWAILSGIVVSILIQILMGLL